MKREVWREDASPTEFTPEHLRESLGTMPIDHDFSNTWGEGFMVVLGAAEERVVGNRFTSIHIYKTVLNPTTRDISPKTLPTVEVGFGHWRTTQDTLYSGQSTDRLTVERVEAIQFTTGTVGEEEQTSEWLLFKGTSGADEVLLYVRGDGKVVYHRGPANREQDIPNAREEVEMLKQQK